MQPLAQPPRKDDRSFDDWMYRLWKRIASSAGLAWSLIDKTGANITDIPTRNHADLQNLNTATYSHLSAAHATDLTDGGESALHYHAADRVDANQTFTDVTTNDASTTKHGFLLKATAPAAGIRNIVAIDNGETGYKNTALVDNTAPADLAGTASSGTSLLAARRDHVHLGLTSVQLTDLTDAGDSTLHYHASDRDSANFTGTSWNDLTDSGATTLHKHDHAAQDNLNSANYTHLTATNHTDLTDGGDSTLHFHASDRARANHTGTQDTTTITVASIGGAATLQNSRNDVNSAGYVDGFTITDTGGGNISVAAGECTLRSSASRLAQIYHVTISSPTALSIPLGSVRYVVVDYNAGSPVVQLDTTNPTDLFTKCYIAEIHNPDGTLHIHFDPRASGDIANRVIAWADGLFGMRVVSGEAVSSVAVTRTIAVTSGVSWDGHLNSYTSSNFNSAGADRFTLEYMDGAGGWTEVFSQSAWPNTQYDNGTGTLATLGNNKWGVLWVIREWQDGVYIQFGQAEYANQADAEAASQPETRPEYLTYHGFYVAKIVFQKSATTYAVIQDYRPLIGGGNAGTAVGNHENLSVLLGGAANDHYHLTGAQQTDLTDGGESSLHYHLSDRIHARNCAALRV